MSYSRSNDDSIVVVIGLIIAAFVLGAIGFGIYSATHVETHAACVVTDKDRTTNRDNKSDARIYTENCGTFQVSDSLLSWTFSSADTYASIKVGETYDFKTRGFRVPFFSAFSNIVEATPVS